MWKEVLTLKCVLALGGPGGGGGWGREFRHMLKMLGKRGHVERSFGFDIRVCMHLMGYLMEWASHKNVAPTSVGPTDL